MAPSNNFCFILFFFTCSFIVRETIAVQCNEYWPPQCMFTVDDDGKRCTWKDNACVPSERIAKQFAGKDGSYKCLSACNLKDPNITELCESQVKHICWPGCINECPSIVDFFNTVLPGEVAQKCGASATAPVPETATFFD